MKKKGLLLTLILVLAMSINLVAFAAEPRIGTSFNATLTTSTHSRSTGYITKTSDTNAYVNIDTYTNSSGVAVYGKIVTSNGVSVTSSFRITGAGTYRPAYNIAGVKGDLCKLVITSNVTSGSVYVKGTWLP